ncbi:AAA family ATPase, partial [Actinokineospora sp.]|uniref:AAA family ATPase n=1 Tax=Actinokineospora sp. TaxID=1872133 RepID=UPI0040378267
MRLPGRDGELVAIGELPASDGPRVLVFEGAPGIGKTALLDEAAVQADERGQVVMSGRCTLFERAHPFSLFLDFLGDGELFDEFRPPQGWSECVDQTRYRALGRALHAALASAAADRGMLVTLDDIHLADPSSVLLLAALLRHKLPDSVRFVLAFRTGRAQARLESALGALSPAPPRHRLGPLDDDAVCGLYPSATPHRRRALLSASGGNPGYLHILADLPTATGARLGSASARPVDVGAMTHRAATIAAELRGLPAEARMVAQTAAVLGESVHPDDLAAVHGAAVAPAIDLLAELDILDGGGLLTFRHPLVRSVAYWMAAPHWRIETHRRAADHLRAAGASAAGYARHVAASAGIGDHGAVSVLTAAARTLADREPAVAADWLAIGIRIEGERVDAGADRVGRATLLALPALDATDPVVRRELMDRAAALLAGATDDELVAALGALPTLLWAEFHGEHGDWVYRRVAALADRYDCRQITAELSLLRSAMAIRRGQLADGMRYAEDAAASGTAAQRAMAAELVVAPLLWQCGRTRARAALAAVPAAHSDTWWSRAGTHGRAEVLLALGEPVAARAVLAAARRRGGAPDTQRPGRRAAAARAAQATGDLDAA